MTNLERKSQVDILNNQQIIFKQQLKQYFGKVYPEYQMVTENTQQRILEIIGRNNQIAQILDSTEYKKNVLEKEKKLKGPAKSGVIICIDGRDITIIPFGRTINVWKEPAAFAETDSQGRLKSTLLTMAIGAEADRELLEVVMVHTSLKTDHKCGRMMVGKEKDDPKFEGMPLEEINKQLLEEKQLPAIEKTFNKARKWRGKEPLQQVAITAFYDTDTMGLVLGHGSEKELSTTELIKKYGGQVEYIIGENLGEFGFMKNNFVDVDNFCNFSKTVADITEFLLESKSIGFSAEVKNYVDKEYFKLTPNQKQALVFLFARTAAAQYLTGLAEVPSNGPMHPFADHAEMAMAISTDGKHPGRFDPGIQIFGASASNEKIAIGHLKTQLSIMDKKVPQERKPHILFVSKAIDRASLTDSESRIRTEAEHAKLLRAVQHDESINKRVINGDIVIVPVFVDQNTNEILEIIDYPFDA